VIVCIISLSVGEFSCKLKLAKVIIVYKTDDKLCVNNYRPISVLSVFSKILEKLLYDRLFSFWITIRYLLINSMVFVKDTILIWPY